MNFDVYSLPEAEEWFLANHGGSVVCRDGSKHETCYSYPDAQKFYSKIKTTRYQIGEHEHNR